MTRKPRALDLFCGAGGATKGLQRAGFHVTGIDIRPQPRYCGDLFVQGDALRPPVNLAQFDFVWASPPCQGYLNPGQLALAAMRRKHKPLPVKSIAQIRAMLEIAGTPYVIENVPGAPLRRDIVLDGDMFGLNTHRRRIFEASFFVLHPPPNPIFGPFSRTGAVSVAGHTRARVRKYIDRTGRIRFSREGSAAEWRAAMAIDWMVSDELKEAVPPAYSEFIGRAALRYIGSAA